MLLIERSHQMLVVGFLQQLKELRSYFTLFGKYGRLEQLNS